MRYVGFYTSEPFWAISEPDIDKLKHDAISFTKELSRTVVIYNGVNFKVEISKDGFIIFQIPKLELKRNAIKESLKKSVDEVVSYNSDYLAYINAFQFLLASSASIEQRLSHFDNSAFSIQDVFQVTKIENGISYYTPQSFLGNHYILGRKITEYISLDEIRLDERISMRMVIDEKVFDKCNKDFDKILSEKDAYLIFSQINSSFSECKKLNFRESLMISWFCIEYFINKAWINYLVKKKEEGNEKINGTRRDILIGKEFTSSIVTQFLELNDEIPFDVFLKINNVRAKRNRIVHNLDLVKSLAKALKDSSKESEGLQIKYTDCLDAFDVLKYFIEAEYQIEVRMSNSFSLREI